MNYHPKCTSDYESSDDNMVASIASTTLQIEPKNWTVKIGNNKVGLVVDPGSVCSILNKSLATEIIINNSSLAGWLSTAPEKTLKHLPMRKIPVIGKMQTPVACNGCRIEDAEFVMVTDI